MAKGMLLWPKPPRELKGYALVEWYRARLDADDFANYWAGAQYFVSGQAPML